ncbi:hypothetical protein [Pseudomonas japonica]|uniref:hypothetical protein n=1 Tax=Pseudomonas japonica TaxID=256466 RepID=UPI0015E4950C|nr:hypothetical protein [Pseudomonas japonica]MBA1243837.1 hypothetical protein [Pseudomonas japonica]
MRPKSDTRARLIRAIAERLFDGSEKKILIRHICDSVGITRQSFNRYYDDLKPYLNGEKLIGELLGNDSTGSTEHYLVQSQSTISALEMQVEHLKTIHSKELKKVTENYVTTLMNNDITLWQVDKTRATVEKQNTLIDDYCKQITDLKLKLTNVELEKFNYKSGVNLQSKILLEPNFTSAFNAIHDGDQKEKFEALKDTELQKLAAKASQYTDDSLYSLVIFLDLYICNFQKFAEHHPRDPDKTYVYIKLPIFSVLEMRLFLKKIAKSSSIFLYVPYCKSEHEKSAQRKFHFRQIPEIELTQADQSPTYKLEHGFTQVTHYTITQGD